LESSKKKPDIKEGPVVNTSRALFVWQSLWGLLILILWLAGAQAASVNVPGPLVETDWLEANLDQVVLLDVRHNVESFHKRANKGGGPAGLQVCGARSKEKAPLVVSGHIPGAALVPWKEVREKRKERGVELKGMRPSREAFEKLMQKAGVNRDSAVVITSEGQNPKQVIHTTRLYWTLKYFGHDNVAVLNGGTAKWMKEKHKIEHGKSRPERGDFAVSAERSELLATTNDVLKAMEAGKPQLLDVRGQDQYLGLTYYPKFVKPKAKGHIPGAKNYPITLLVNSAGPVATFYSAEDVRKVSNLLGIDLSKPTIAYCNSAAMASLGWFVMHELLGNEKVSLYDGSMHEWSMDPKRPLVAMKIE
jgi:thiosulfate/3-mercaptopyruvate sulfurtransferase